MAQNRLVGAILFHCRNRAVDAVFKLGIIEPHAYAHPVAKDDGILDRLAGQMKLLAIGGAEKGLSGRAVLQGGVDAPKGQVLFGQVVVLVRHQVDAFALRSEEHTSELQSLMRISYAVFCLKKKKIQ